MLELFTDGDLFGAHQIDIFEALAETPAEIEVDRYGAEPGVIDLFGAGQLSLTGL
jgi:hypothetical protein